MRRNKATSAVVVIVKIPVAFPVFTQSEFSAAFPSPDLARKFRSVKFCEHYPPNAADADPALADRRHCDGRGSRHSPYVSASLPTAPDRGCL